MRGNEIYDFNQLIHVTMFVAIQVTSIFVSTINLYYQRLKKTKLLLCSNSPPNYMTYWPSHKITYCGGKISPHPPTPPKSIVIQRIASNKK